MVEEAMVITLVAIGLVVGAGEAAQRIVHSLETVECALEQREVCVHEPIR